MDHTLSYSRYKWLILQLGMFVEDNVIIFRKQQIVNDAKNMFVFVLVRSQFFKMEVKRLHKKYIVDYVQTLEM